MNHHPMLLNKACDNFNSGDIVEVANRGGAMSSTQSFSSMRTAQLMCPVSKQFRESHVWQCEEQEDHRHYLSGLARWHSSCNDGPPGVSVQSADNSQPPCWTASDKSMSPKTIQRAREDQPLLLSCQAQNTNNMSSYSDSKLFPHSQTGKLCLNEPPNQEVFHTTRSPKSIHNSSSRTGDKTATYLNTNLPKISKQWSTVSALSDSCYCSETPAAPAVCRPESSRCSIARRGLTSCRWMGFVAMLSCLLAITGHTVEGRAVDTDQRYKKLTMTTVKYLAQFGYLNGPSRETLETQDLRSHEDLTRAIKTLQRAGGIPETGLPDRRTVKLMKKPRCGNTDDFMDDSPSNNNDHNSRYPIRKKRYTTTTTNWPRTNLTFRFINYTSDMPQQKTRRLIQDAFKVWSDETPISFTEVSGSNADIMIQFASRYHADGYPFDGRGMVLAHAFFPGNGKGGDTHFDDDEFWSGPDSTDGVDLFMVAAHEFGHALGLAHSGDPEALMYPWYMGFEGKFRLPNDDRNGIISLYGTGEKDFSDGVKLLPNGHTPQDPIYDIDVTGDRGKEVAEDGPVDPCNSRFDAVTFMRNEIFIFIGKHYWRLNSHKLLIPKSSHDFHQLFYELPKDIEKIDAVYEQPDGKTVFFSGNRFWIFTANRLVNKFPTSGKSITELSIPSDVKHIDAAFVWGYNNRTYLVSGDMYWKMNENNTFVQYDYPRDMGTWHGVPVPLDAAYTDRQGKTVFFQGQDFWEFYDIKMTVKRGFPKRSYRYWLNCPETNEGPERVRMSDSQHLTDIDGKEKNGKQKTQKMQSNTDKNTANLSRINGLLILVLLIFHSLRENNNN